MKPVNFYNLARVEKKIRGKIEERLAEVGVFLQADIVLSFGSPPSMPKGWKTARIQRKAMFRAKRKIQAQSRRTAKRVQKTWKTQHAKFLKKQKSMKVSAKVQARKLTQIMKQVMKQGKKNLRKFKRQNRG